MELHTRIVVMMAIVIHRTALADNMERIQNHKKCKLGFFDLEFIKLTEIVFEFYNVEENCSNSWRFSSGRIVSDA